MFALHSVRTIAHSAASEVARARLAGSCKVLIAESRQGSLEAVKARVENLGYQRESVTTPRQAIKAIGRDTNLGIALIEATEHHTDGMRFLERLHLGSAIVSIVVAEAPALPQAVRALQLGATDLIPLEAPVEQLANSLRRAASIWNKSILRNLRTTSRSRYAKSLPTKTASTTMQERLSHEIAIHDARQVHFGRIACGDRTWRIVLELAVASVEGREVTASMLARATNLHASAIARRIARLVHCGAVEQYSHSADRRNVCLKLREPILAKILSACEA